MLLTILLVGLLAALVLWFGPGSHDADKIARRLPVFGGLIGTGLIVLVICYAGWSRYPAQIPRDRLARFQFSGYYVGAATAQPRFRFADTEKSLTSLKAMQARDPEIRGGDDGFVTGVLASEDAASAGARYLAVLPQFQADAKPLPKVIGWKIRAHLPGVPIRVDGKVANPEVRWLQDGDTIQIALKDPVPTSRYVSLRYSRTESGFSIFHSTNERFSYNQGTQDAAGFHPDLEQGIGGLQDDAPVRTRLARTLLTTLDQGAANRWKNRCARPFEPSADSDGRFRQLLSSVILVRESSEAGSRLGLLWDEELLVRDRASLWVNGAPPPAPPEEQTIGPVGGDPRLSVGMGGSRLIDLRFSSTVTEFEDRKLLVASFVRPEEFPLPPTAPGAKPGPWIVTSGRDAVPMDGYSFATGNDDHPFYGKLAFASDVPAMQITDGKAAPQPPDQKKAAPSAYRTLPERGTFYLGDNAQGISVGWRLLRPTIPFGGLAAMGLIGLATALFVLYCRRFGELFEPIDLAWGFAWAAALALCTIRFLLGFRAGVLPPANAVPADLTRFSGWFGAYGSGLIALSIPSLMVVTAFWARRRPRPFSLLGSRAVLYVIAGLPTAVTLYALITHQPDSVFRMRVNILIDLLVVLVLWRVSPLVEANRKWLWLLAAAALVPFLVNMLLLKDLGSFLYLFGILAALFVAARPSGFTLDEFNRWLRRKWTRPAGLAVGALAAVWLLWLGTNLGLEKVVLPNMPDAYLRVLRFTGGDVGAIEDPVQSQKLKLSSWHRLEQQLWQMDQYAIQGVNEPAGYEHGTLSDVGMNYRTALSDCAFLVFLLAENGWMTALLTIVLGVALAAAIVLGATRFRREVRARAVPLMAIAGFYAINGPYMAAADLGKLPFTGQNIPLLGLDSVSDILQSAVLLVLVSILLVRGRGISMPTPEPVNRGSVWAGRTLLSLGSILIALVVLGVLSKHGRDLEDYDVPSDYLHKINTNAARIALNPKNHADPGALHLTALESTELDRFNEQPDKRDPSLGLYYLRPRESLDPTRKPPPPVLAVNEQFYRIQNPLMAPKIGRWRGNITAPGRSGRQPTLYMIRSPLEISVSDQGHPTGIRITSEGSTVGARSINLLNDAGDPMLELVRPYTGGPKRTVASSVKVTAKFGEYWSVYCEGTPMARSAPRDLNPNDILVVEDLRTDPPQRYNLIYLGDAEPKLAFFRWRNGAEQPVYRPDAEMPMLVSMVSAAQDAQTQQIDIAKTSKKPAKQIGDLRLSLDIDLHRDLQSQLDDYAGVNAPYASSSVMGPSLSMAVMDTYSGEVLALPSWPHDDILRPDFDRDYRRSSQLRQERMLENHNLTNHAIGSTVKPLTLAAVSALYEGKTVPGIGQFGIGNLGVYGWQNPHSWLGTARMAGEYMAPVQDREMNMSRFIIKSYDWPAVILGSLGLITDVSDLPQIMRPGQTPADLSLNGVDLRLDLLHAKDSLFFKEQDQQDGNAMFRTYPVHDALLFSSYKGLYDVSFQDYDAPEFPQQTVATTFLPPLAPPVKDWTNSALAAVMPSPYAVPVKDFRQIRSDLVPFLLGSGQNRWNNVWMAQAYSRIVTGQRVSATLTRGRPVKVEALAPPLSDPKWREEHLLGPMEGVAAFEEGTGASLAPLQAKLKQAGYRLLMKSGTIGNREKRRKETHVPNSEALAIVVGKVDGQGHFIKGRTLTGYLFMEDSDIKGMTKWSFAAPLIETLFKFLQQAPG